MKVRKLNTVRLFALVGLLSVAACGDSTGPDNEFTDEVAVVLNSVERSLTVIPTDGSADPFTIGVAPEGTPVSVAARNNYAIVPLGVYPFAAVVDLVSRGVTATVPLPDGSGATGAAFLNDSIALVGNPELNTVTPVNVYRGTAGEQIPVGTYPQGIVTSNGMAYVLNARLVNFAPAGPATVTVIDGALNPVATIQLSGLNPGSGTIGTDGRLYVIHSGNFGSSNGSLSVVDLGSRTEVGHYTGFGNYPGSVAASESRIFATLYSDGIVEWNASSASFVRGPTNPLTPGNIPPVSGIGADSEERLFAINPGTCEEPGTAYRLNAAGEADLQWDTGICPFGLAFTFLPED